LEEGVVTYTNLRGDVIEMKFQTEALTPLVKQNGILQNFKAFKNPQQSPYVNIKAGSSTMRVWDGKQGYEVDFKGDWPIYRTLKGGGQ
jgi:hypothetical protein